MTWLEGLERKLREELPELELRKNEPMSRHTSFKVGGPATLMALPKMEGEAQEVLRVAHGLGITPFILGNGTNLLVSDAGYEGFIVKPCLTRLEPDGEEGILVGSGVLLSRLANFALELGLTGLEFAHGIPGTVGGAVYMNAGAYDGEMCQVVVSTTYLEPDGTVGVARGEEHAFAYRHSAFDRGSRLILRSRLALKRGDPAAIKARMDDLAAQRKAKQPLEYPSAGSTFKRPPAVSGQPVYAAALIDQCGCKGLTVGGAQVSEKHAGFIINKGGATCADILALVEEVKRRVYDQTGIALELEVKTLGV